MKESFAEALRAPVGPQGFQIDEAGLTRRATVENNGDSAEITHGAVTIAAITSCTNTSNPSVMVAAGLVAQKAAEKGLRAKPYVKTSLAPGSRVVTDYLEKSGLDEALEDGRLLHGWLRLHHLHWQQRSAARAGGRCGHVGRFDCVGCAVGQSKFRRPRSIRW